MKKLLPVVIALLILLTACGKFEDTVSPSEDSETPSTESIETESAETDSKTIIEPTITILTKEKYMETTDKFLEEQGFTTFSSLTPSKKDMGNGMTTYGYNMNPNVTIYLYESNDTKNLIQVYMAANTSGITQESLNSFGYANALTIKGFEGDNAESIDAQLNMSNISEDASNVAVSDHCTYTYVVKGSSLMFTAMPN